MKVVLFCGGQGMRIRDYSDEIPKPLVPIGHRPILWHLMKYYAQFGHTEFILCLGYQGGAIRRFFLDYREEMSNDFVLRGPDRVELLDQDLDQWTITFVDTGVHTPIAERLLRVKDHIGDDEMFLANYADAVTDMDHDKYMNEFLLQEVTAGLVSVRPPQTYHVLEIDEGSAVTGVNPMAETDIWLNGGFFIFRREIFDYIKQGDELTEAPFSRLIGEGNLYAHKFTGFWAAMDTFKDKNRLDSLYEHGDAPWVLWSDGSNGRP